MRKKSKKKTRGKKMISIWLTIMIVFITELFFYTRCRVQYVEVGYEITKATAEQEKLLALQRNLKIELARLKSPKRIEQIARQELGLVAPSIEQIMIIP